MKYILYALICFSVLLNFLLIRQQWNNSIVIAVPDGDTLQLADGRRVRLRSIDAPEQGRCEASEAAQFLTSTAIHNRIHFTDRLTDSYGRILAVAFIGNKNLNELMLEKGLARHFFSGTNYDNLLSNASNKAKESGLGIFSGACRSATPKNNCVIKGNLRSGEKTYYLPSCRDYNQVVVDEAYGDVWLCSESDAIKNGYSRAARCSN